MKKALLILLLLTGLSVPAVVTTASGPQCGGTLPPSLSYSYQMIDDVMVEDFTGKEKGLDSDSAAVPLPLDTIGNPSFIPPFARKSKHPCEKISN